LFGFSAIERFKSRRRFEIWSMNHPAASRAELDPQRSKSVFKSNQEFFQATKDFIVVLRQSGRHSEADTLQEGLGLVSGLTDGWALLLDSVKEVEKSAGTLTASERKKLTEIHDAVYEAVYRRRRRPWWKLWQV
jgi:hypothetical protein